MSRALITRARLRAEDGSLPLALLATIVVAGMIAVTLARSVAGEDAVRFDRDYAESLQVADVGINRGLFALNEAQTPPPQASPQTATVDGIDYEWYAEQLTSRQWEVVSQSTTPSGVSRRLVATVEDQPLFFPGAFGDRLVALNGTSTEVDSYNSDPSCTALTTFCGWGNTTSDVYQEEYGTGNGSIGTNDDFDFAGNTTVRPGGAFLYDWADNPANGITASDPFGDRCDGNPCTEEFIRTVDERLDLAEPTRMEFITNRFLSGAACDGSENNRRKGDWVLGTKNATTTIESYHSAATGTGTPAIQDPTDPAFNNFYCADSLELRGDIRLDPTVTTSNPVVIFVKDYVTVPDSGSLIACHNPASTAWCDKNDVRNVKPQANRLQIYVAGIPAGNNSTAGDISIKSQSMFAGVLYAPRSRCGGNGGIDVYGAVICGTMDQVGNWDFHYDDALGSYGSGLFSIAFWEEVAPQ